MKVVVGPSVVDGKYPVTGTVVTGAPFLAAVVVVATLVVADADGESLLHAANANRATGMTNEMTGKRRRAERIRTVSARWGPDLSAGTLRPCRWTTRSCPSRCSATDCW